MEKRKFFKVDVFKSDVDGWKDHEVVFDLNEVISYHGEKGQKYFSKDDRVTVILSGGIKHKISMTFDDFDKIMETNVKNYFVEPEKKFGSYI